MKIQKNIKTIAAIAVAVILIIAVIFALGSKLGTKRYDKVSRYTDYRHEGMTGEGLMHFNMDGMGEIWPSAIPETATVESFELIYKPENEGHYLGHLIVNYNAEDFETETNRLRGYPSNNPKGLYGFQGFQGCDMLAMNGSEAGFVYAVSRNGEGGAGTIAYVEIVFPDYLCELDVKEYIPEEYLPTGLNVGEGNPTLASKSVQVEVKDDVDESEIPEFFDVMEDSSSSEEEAAETGEDEAASESSETSEEVPEDFDDQTVEENLGVSEGE